MKKEKGITLIALVITVIILLILAGVAMSMITGNGGIFTKANEAATVYNQKAQEEAEQVQGLMDMLEQYAGGGSRTPAITRTTVSTPITTAINNVHIGDYIDLGTNVLEKITLTGIDANGVIQRLDEEIKADYRIFYVGKNTDSDEYKGKVFAILADYLPNSTNIISDSEIDGIKQLEGRTYAVVGTNVAPTLTDALTGPYNSNDKLSDLIGNKLIDKNALLSLAPTSLLFKKSYDAKVDGGDFNLEIVGEDFNLNKESLYIPRLINVDNTRGYWLSDLNITGNHNGIWSGAFWYGFWWDDDTAVRPVICLGSDVDVKWNETRGVWEVQ